MRSSIIVVLVLLLVSTVAFADSKKDVVPYRILTNNALAIVDSCNASVDGTYNDIVFWNPMPGKKHVYSRYYAMSNMPETGFVCNGCYVASTNNCYEYVGGDFRLVLKDIKSYSPPETGIYFQGIPQ